MLPKVVLTDIDGVWTDGGMYYDKHDNELKKFNTYDSAGILFCKIIGIETGIITGEDTNIVKRRADKLSVDICCLGVKDKVTKVEQIIKDRYTWEEVAYLGDDINDIGLLQRVGFSATPSSAPEYVKKHSKIHLQRKGGEGVFREFVEFILISNNLMDYVIEKYLESNLKFKQ